VDDMGVESSNWRDSLARLELVTSPQPGKVCALLAVRTIPHLFYFDDGTLLLQFFFGECIKYAQPITMTNKSIFLGES
jgi:hypothetical protein